MKLRNTFYAGLAALALGSPVDAQVGDTDWNNVCNATQVRNGQEYASKRDSGLVVGLTIVIGVPLAVAGMFYCINKVCEED